jgi:uncharacterized membrane protein YbaN (DUF454 family)
MQRAEEIVDCAAIRVSDFAACCGRGVMRLISCIKKEAEHLWGEAQSIRRGGSATSQTQAKRAASPASVPLPEFALEPIPYRPLYVTGIRRILYRIFGWASVGMAVVGAITPGIPTPPFVILAGYFFIRSSPAAHQWLRRSRWFGSILRNWEEHHGVSRSVRNGAVGLIVVSMVLIALLGLPLPLVLVILAMQIICLVFVLRLRVVEQPLPKLALVAP